MRNDDRVVADDDYRDSLCGVGDDNNDNAVTVDGIDDGYASDHYNHDRGGCDKGSKCTFNHRCCNGNERSEYTEYSRR